ncbi:MAG: hypothetical protein B9S32_03555 [Verrucomicrobia bacterium Tous-C9LFEB]|nr:MAG: hypothetical protein B9S32_03555 [Verrucomicrobia bacterium Tous-C9LFEB]
MKKVKDFSRYLVIGAILLLGQGSNSAWSAANLARVDISSSPKDEINLEIGTCSPLARVTHADWLSPEQRTRFVTAHFPATTEWQEGFVTLTPSKSGNVSITLMGVYLLEDAAAKKIRCIQIDFDEVQADSVVIKNGGFEKKENENRPASWSVSDLQTGNPPVDDSNRAKVEGGSAKAGSHFMRAWHNSRVSQSFFVEAKTPITIRFYYRLSEK